MSVLNDFDLSSIKDAPKGFERTGTVPFMSLDLLTQEAIAGDVEHVYRHDAESFIWVLTWVCLRYERGKLLSKGGPLDEWLTGDAMRCYKNKMSFFGMLRWMCSKRLGSHEENFKVAIHCLAVIFEYTGPFAIVPADDEKVFLIWLQNLMFCIMYVKVLSCLACRYACS
jgi:hypothetical protein